MKKNKIISSSTAAVCIVSGGIDSVCTAAYLKKQNFDLYIITFRYGQRANLEIEYAKKFAKYLDSKEHKISPSTTPRRPRPRAPPARAGRSRASGGGS